MTANITYRAKQDSFCDHSRVANFVRASELLDSDYRSLILDEATDAEVQDAIEQLEADR